MTTSVTVMQSPSAALCSTAVTVEEPVTPGRVSLFQVEVVPTPPRDRFLGRGRGLLPAPAVEQADDRVAEQRADRQHDAGDAATAADAAERAAGDAAEHARRGRAGSAFCCWQFCAGPGLRRCGGARRGGGSERQQQRRGQDKNARNIGNTPLARGGKS